MREECQAGDQGCQIHWRGCVPLSAKTLTLLPSVDIQDEKTTLSW
jgi:hypothetical protein